MVERRITFRDLIPYVAKAPENDPHGASLIIADLLQHFYDKMRMEIRGIPRLLSPDFIDADYILSGHLSFSSAEQLGTARCSSFIGSLFVTLLGPPFQVPVSDFFNSHAVFFTTGVNAGEYRRINQYVYAPTPTPNYGGIMDKPWVGFTNTLGNPSGIEQIALCFPDRVWLPADASDVDEYYSGMYLRVAGGGPYLTYGIDIQTRKIVSYDGTKRIAYLEKAFDLPPDPTSFFGITPSFVPMQYLGRHVGLDLPPDLIEGLKRQLILNAVNIYKLKGTRKGFEVLLKVLGWLSEIVEIGSNYARPTYPMPWYDFNNVVYIPYAGSTTPVPVKVGPEPDLPIPYRRDWVYAYFDQGGVAGSFPGENEYVKIAEDRPIQVQFDSVELLTQTAEGIGYPPWQHIISGVVDYPYVPFPGAGVGTMKYVLDPNLDLAGDTTDKFKIPDSDIKLFIAPATPLPEVPTTAIFHDILRAVEDVRPIHVEIDGIGWLNKVTEVVGMQEEFVVSLFLGINDTISIATSVAMFTGATQDVDEGGSFLALVSFTRPARWDVTADHWDGIESLTGAFTWDTSVIAVGED